MARDLNRIVESLRNSREVYVTDDGQVEDNREAQENVSLENSGERTPQTHTRLKPDVFASELRVHQSVLDGMHSEARRFDVETGGVLVGPDANTISELIASGPEARRSASAYQFDVTHLQPQLEAAELRGLRFLGAWHVHPKGCASLSSTDQQTARRMINDPDYGICRVLLPLTTRTSGHLETRFFIAEGREAKIRRIENIVVYADAAIEKTANQQSLEGFAKGAKNAQNGAPSGLITSRIVEDIRQLKEAGWKVSHRRSGDNQALRTEHSGKILWVLLPPEYPLNAPDILIEHGEDLLPVPYPQLLESQTWSSRRSLSDLLGQAKIWADTSNMPKRITRIKANNPRQRSLWTAWRKAS